MKNRNKRMVSKATPRYDRTNYFETVPGFYGEASTILHDGSTPNIVPQRYCVSAQTSTPPPVTTAQRVKCKMAGRMGIRSIYRAYGDKSDAYANRNWRMRRNLSDFSEHFLASGKYAALQCGTEAIGEHRAELWRVSAMSAPASTRMPTDSTPPGFTVLDSFYGSGTIVFAV
jgi:hypothetical protein